MASIFTRIVNGEIPCHKIWADENYFAFLDLRPLNPGHTLVIPKKEVDYVFDLEDEILKGLFVAAKKIAKAIKKAVPCRKIAIVVYGLEVPHAHVHLVPVHGVAGEIDFRNAKKAEDEELKSIAGKIKANL